MEARTGIFGRLMLALAVWLAYRGLCLVERVFGGVETLARCMTEFGVTFSKVSCVHTTDTVLCCTVHSTDM